MERSSNVSKFPPGLNHRIVHDWSVVFAQVDEKEEKEHKLDVLVASNHAVMITLQLFYAQIASVAWTPWWNKCDCAYKNWENEIIFFLAVFMDIWPRGYSGFDLNL